MNKDNEAAFERWWKREESSGLALSDDYEVAVMKTVAKAAYKAGIRKARLAEGESK